jgi:hypothetical protein
MGHRSGARSISFVVDPIDHRGPGQWNFADSSLQIDTDSGNDSGLPFSVDNGVSVVARLRFRNHTFATLARIV